MTNASRFPYDPPDLSPDSGRLPVRTTAAALLVEDGRLLLEKRPGGERPAAGLWDTPGGHVEEGEAPEVALVRELAEELGIRATRFKLATVQDEQDRPTGHLYRHFVYIVLDWKGHVTPREGQHLAWHALDEVLALPALNPLVGHALEQLIRSGWLST